jgi:hypothetical protein
MLDYSTAYFGNWRVHDSSHVVSLRARGQKKRNDEGADLLCQDEPLSTSSVEGVLFLIE